MRRASGSIPDVASRINNAVSSRRGVSRTDSLLGISAHRLSEKEKASIDGRFSAERRLPQHLQHLTVIVGYWNTKYIGEWPRL